MALKLANNATGVLASNTTALDTTIALQAGHGSDFPVLGLGDWFPLTLARADGSLEIVRVTARSGDTLTIERGQEGTQAISFSVGDRVSLRLTTQTLEDRLAMLQDELDFNYTWNSLAGVVLAYDGVTPPSGWLFCYGQIFQVADYPRLFAALGSRYGGNGTTTFGIPDRRGRVAAGRDDMGASAAGRLSAQIAGTTLGAVGGAETHVLTAGQMPSHSHGVTDAGHAHTVSDPTHAHSVSDPTHAHGVYDPGHAHTYDRYSAIAPATQQSGSNQSRNSQTLGTGASLTGIGIYGAATGIAIYAAGTGVTVQARVTGISIQNSGSDQAHNNLQPTIITNYIIRT